MTNALAYCATGLIVTIEGFTVKDRERHASLLRRTNYYYFILFIARDYFIIVIKVSY